MKFYLNLTFLICAGALLFRSSFEDLLFKDSLLA